MLAFRKERFTPAQLLLCALAIVDVGVRSVPLDRPARFIAQWIGAEKKPAVLSVTAPQTGFRLSGSVGSDHPLPGIPETAQVVWMHRSRPPPTVRLVRGQTKKLQIVPIEKLSTSVWLRRPGERRHSIYYHLEVALACPNGIFGPLPIIDV